MSRCCHSHLYNPETPSFSSFIGLIFILFFLGGCFISCNRSLEVSTGEEQIVVGTVTDKGIKRIHDEDTYLIYTKDIDTNKPEVYQITDSILAGRFDSADVYADIEVGKTYQFGIRGSRSTFFSWYPNIYSCKEMDIESIRVELPTNP